MAHPDVGAGAPEFTLSDQNSETFTLSKALQAGPVVLFFYPADGTPVCTKETCAFRDALERFNTFDCTVAGISSDSVERHAEFARERNISFPLLADTEQVVRKQYGATVMRIMPGRVTFVIDSGGVIRTRFDSQLGTDAHVEAALAGVQALSET